MTQETEFWDWVDKGDPDECWNWFGGKTTAGYGKLWFRGSIWQAHRVALILSDEKLSEEVFVCHSCDNRLCCNPSHLFVGTDTDNVRDMFSKGRGHNHIKTTDKSIRDKAILEDWTRTHSTFSELASRHDVSRSVAHKACTKYVQS